MPIRQMFQQELESLNRDVLTMGDLTAKIEINQKDEIGELAEAVSRMQASLQGAINRLRARRTPMP
jgi:methyl-accepting chemotaxis protein